MGAAVVEEERPLAGATAPARRWRGARLGKLRRHPSALFGGLVLLAIVAVTLLAPQVAPSDPLATAPREARQPPSMSHLLGTDHLGRDLLSRIIYGSRVSLLLGVIAVAIGGTVGITLGIVAGYFRGLVDTAIMQVNDMLLAFPGFLLALGAVAVLGTGIYNVMVAVGVSLVPTFARMARGSVLSAREMDYVAAARVIGVGHVRIMARHILPNILAPLIVLATVGIGGAILTAASLSFIGVGAQPPQAEWGLMVNEGRRYLRIAWWISTFPGLAIMAIVIAINLVGDALRDVLDPRLRL